MGIWIHIKTQFYILIRYMSVFFSIIATAFAIGILLSIMYEYQRLFNIPLVITIGSSFLGPMLGDMFSGKKEYMNYCLTPWSIRTILFSKCIVWILFMIIVPLLLIFGSSFFFESAIGEYKSAILFWVTSMPVFLILGTRISIIPRGESTADSNTSLYLLMSLTIPVAAMPYALFYVWLGSLPSCILFSIIIFLIWYVFVLPAVITNFKLQHYNLETK